MKIETVEGPVQPTKLDLLRSAIVDCKYASQESDDTEPLYAEITTQLDNLRSEVLQRNDATDIVRSVLELPYSPNTPLLMYCVKNFPRQIVANWQLLLSKPDGLNLLKKVIQLDPYGAYAIAHTFFEADDPLLTEQLLLAIFEANPWYAIGFTSNNQTDQDICAQVTHNIHNPRIQGILFKDKRNVYEMLNNHAGDEVAFQLLLADTNFSPIDGIDWPKLRTTVLQSTSQITNILTHPNCLSAKENEQMRFARNLPTDEKRVALFIQTLNDNYSSMDLYERIFSEIQMQDYEMTDSKGAKVRDTDGKTIFVYSAMLAEYFSKNSQYFFIFYRFIAKYDWCNTLLRTCIAKNPSTAFEFYGLHKNFQLLKDAGKDHPIYWLQYGQYIKDYLQGGDKDAYKDAIRSLTNNDITSIVNEILVWGKTPVSVQSENAPTPPDRLIINGSTYFDCFSNSEFEERIMRALFLSMRTRCSSPDYLQFVLEFNRLHDERGESRFRLLQHAEARDIYDMIVYGREEVFTSTYLELFASLQKKEANINRVFEDCGYRKIMTFVEAAISYGNIESLLRSITNQTKFWEKCREDIGLQAWPGNLASVVTIIELGDHCKGKKEFRDLYNGIVSFVKSKIGDNTQTSKRDDDEYLVWNIVAKSIGIEGISDTFTLDTLARLDEASLYEENNHYERYYFYNDSDGHRSFESFTSAHSTSRGWKLDTTISNDQMVHYSRIIGGKTQHIYANKPGGEIAGNAQINQLLAGKRLHVFVHRGHSTHAESSISCIESETPIIFLGSCGGYNNIAKVLLASNHANIIATRQTGSMLVNDILLPILEDAIASKEPINWAKIWKSTEQAGEKKYTTTTGELQKFRKYFAQYVNPDLNRQVMFMKTFNRLRETYRPS